jgi:hypothetical protein
VVPKEKWFAAPAAKDEEPKRAEPEVFQAAAAGRS